MEQLPPIVEFFDDLPVISPSAMHADQPVTIKPNIKTAICTFLCESIDREMLASILADSRLLFYVYGRSGKVPVYQYKDECLIVLMTVGSPVAVGVVEELKYLGIENIIAYYLIVDVIGYPGELSIVSYFIMIFRSNYRWLTEKCVFINVFYTKSTSTFTKTETVSVETMTAEVMDISGSKNSVS